MCGAAFIRHSRNSVKDVSDIKKYFKSIGTLFRAMPLIILFELMYKVILSAVIAPLLKNVLNLAMKIAGIGYLTTENLAKFFTNPAVILLLILVLLAAAFFTLMEISAVLYCLACFYLKKRVTIAGMMKTGIKTSLKIFRARNFVIIFHALFLLAFTQLTTASGLFTYIGLPDVQTLAGISRTRIATCIYIALLAVFTFFIINRIYSLHLFTLTGMSYKQSLQKSMQLMKGKRKKVALSFVLWNVILSLICVLMIFAVSFCIIFVAKGFSDVEKSAVSALRSISHVLKAVMLLSTVFSMPILFSFITVCFFNEALSDIEFKIEAFSPKIKPAKVRIFAGAVIVMSIILNYSYLKNISQENIKLNMSFLNRTKVTAHRGASMSAPENTSYAFEKAMEIGADYVELDVQETADGQLVVFHDKNLKRTTGNKSDLSKLTYDELLELDCGSWFGEEYSDAKIMLLAEALDLMADNIKLNIEIKNFGDVGRIAVETARLTEEYGCSDSCYITSFSYSALRAVKKEYPQIKTGIITNIMSYNSYSKLKYIDAISLNKSFVSQNVVNIAHANGKRVFIWTVNDVYEMKKYITMGVDNIITDCPDKALKEVYSEGTEGYILSVLSWIFNY